MRLSKRQKYARCTDCNVWRAIREMKSDCGIFEAGTEIMVGRYWKCRTHTPKQLQKQARRLAAFVRRLYGPGDEEGERFAREIEERAR